LIKCLEKVILSGEIKVWKAREILEKLQHAAPKISAKKPVKQSVSDAIEGIGYGKVILLGEHSVVYNRHAIAVPAPLSIRTKIEDTKDQILLLMPSWGVEYQLDKDPDKRQSFEKPAGLILDQLGLNDRGMKIEVFSDIPRGMGLQTF